jgi:DDE family transposase
VEAFSRDVLMRLPLAEAVWRLMRHVLDDDFVGSLFEELRGTGSEVKISFASLIRLVNAALLEHGGSGRQAFYAAREAGELQATDAAVYGKLRRVRLELSEAFLERATERLRQVLPEGLQGPLPPCVRGLKVLVVDGKKLKKLPKRLGALRAVRGKVLGGKVVAGLLLNEGLIVSMHASPDGEANDAPLTPGLLARCQAYFDGRHLSVADRQFCDLKIPRLIDEQGHAFLIRYSRKLSFFPERQREFSDARGRTVREAWGYLGRPAEERRMYVRQITLIRPGEEDVILVTNLLKETQFPAEALLEVYLARWTIERVFQQITEVFHLRQFISSTPQGAIFQFALCGLLYNLIQVVRGYIGYLQQRPAHSLSSEMIFNDVTDQMTAASLLLSPERLIDLLAPEPAAQLQMRLSTLLAGQWSALWIKCPPKKQRPPPVRRTVPGGHSSAWKLIQQAKAKPPPS